MHQAGVIFDWDGVVVDSSRLHRLSWEKLAAREGRETPDVKAIGSLGMKTLAVITDLLGWTDDADEAKKLTLDKEAIFRELAHEGGLDPIPGVVDVLRSFRSLGIAVAVGSSAPRLNIEAGMNALGIGDLFDAISCGDEVLSGKPAPDIFLRAAELIGKDPVECVVFEDAPVGVRAARSAGMRVVGVLTAYPEESLQGAERLIQDFREITAFEVAHWLAADREEARSA